GELDVTTSSALKGAIDDAPGACGVILELEEVSFIDSTALGILIGAQRRLRRGGRELRVVVTNPIVVRIITISGVDELFELHASVAAALDVAP
ncbi:MAG TPA: STAS domain-containing protein, partial [Acidimicrobiales bacterium]|nr:STAS domain-containing protein [Acidimicrobiales bacterium]